MSMELKEYQESERAVMSSLAELLTDGSKEQHAYYMDSVLARWKVKADWFRGAENKKMFEAMRKVWREHRVMDVHLVADEYGGEDAWEQVSKLIDAQGTLLHLEYYLKNLRQKYLYVIWRNKMLALFHEATPDTIDLILQRTVQATQDAKDEAGDRDGGLRQISEFMEQSIADKEELHQKRFVEKQWDFMKGLPWMWDFLNVCYTGIKPGLHVIAALASQGKSTLGADLSAYWNTLGIKHGVICIDMAADQFCDRYACVMGRVSLGKLNFGGSKEDLRRFRTAYQEVAKLNNVWISEDDEIEKIQQQVDVGVEVLGWKAVIIDYIQLVAPSEKGQMPEYTRVQRAVQAVKRIAKKKKIPIICLAQLSRAFEKELREQKSDKVGLDAIGDSAEIARAASTVMVIYQDENMRKFWKTEPPVKLAWADPDDRMPYYRLVDVVNETEEQKEERHRGQVSLAKTLRPMWIDVIKNQQGGTAKFPAVMYPSYFLLRPGNPNGESTNETIGGKQVTVPRGMFETLTDDWTYTELDYILQATGAMTDRGYKLAGETLAQFEERRHARMLKHPEVKHLVSEWNGKTREMKLYENHA